MHLERALAIYGAEPNPETFKASTLDLPSVIIRFLALVLWPLGKIDQSRQLAEQAVSVAGEKRALAQANALVHRAVFDGLCGGPLHQTETILALALAREQRQGSAENIHFAIGRGIHGWLQARMIR